ncbi:DNA replication complex GINS protein PSF2, putative [Entamoeba invadens IP1]|uniref:DNA replication complex GINS protein PSF2, putative n=1 Tax=Entamoeba invadens IP1 TaxID=370355 RepID=UPI0002C3D874|nr:DNA replication complex GINS protein PSF2, putative [Entamoeba invadens IP1]ELP93321.1 DNA replication complex GINS protein PSF2, putative [Entamoeba invadens IP1]|eukprot:XP_004260092.1 DNA replication complex GINS protein PSF2, putative [Entamoeba invadens IP1]
MDPLTPTQLQFFSQDLAKISIQMNEPIGRIEMIVGHYGPFEKDHTYEVPLWVGLYFKTNKMCKVIIPSWLHVEQLEQYLEAEETSDLFSPLPFYYQEVAYSLMKTAPEDFEDLDKTRSVFEELRQFRMDKVRAGLHSLNKDIETIMMTNVGATELALAKGFAYSIFESISQLTDAAEGAENHVNFNLRKAGLNE